MSSHHDRTGLVNKGLIIWPKRELFVLGTEITKHEPHLSALVANQNAGSASSCPLADPAIVIN